MSILFVVKPVKQKRSFSQKTQQVNFAESERTISKFAVWKPFKPMIRFFANFTQTVIEGRIQPLEISRKILFLILHFLFKIRFEESLCEHHNFSNLGHNKLAVFLRKSRVLLAEFSRKFPSVLGSSSKENLFL